MSNNYPKCVPKLIPCATVERAVEVANVMGQWGFCTRVEEHESDVITLRCWHQSQVTCLKCDEISMVERARDLGALGWVPGCVNGEFGWLCSQCKGHEMTKEPLNIADGPWFGEDVANDEDGE